MDLELSGKVALVTGASRGIGRAIAEGLAAEEVRLVISPRGSRRDRTARPTAHCDSFADTRLAQPPRR